MDDIERVPSSVFRVTYVGIDRPVAVTVLDRVIGHWVPINHSIDSRFAEALRPGEPESPSGASRALNPTAGNMTQAEKDAVLRRVAKR